MLSHVKVEQSVQKINRHTLFIDGKDLSGGVTGVSIDLQAGEVPECTIDLMADSVEFDGVANVRYDFSPSTVIQAVNVLRNELLKHEEIYRAFVESAVSSLKDLDRQRCGGIDLPPEDFRMVAEAIMSRLVGEEYLYGDN